MTPHDAASGPIRQALAGAETHRLDEPQPLIRDPGPPAPYPTDALGPLAAAARAIVAHTLAPEAIAGQAVLAATALAVQGHVDALHPLTGSRTPLSLFAMTIAASGERKSQVDRLALGPVYAREDALAEEAEAARARYEIDRDLYEAKRGAALKGVKEKPEDIGGEADLRALGEPPPPPLAPLLVFTEPTFEGYVRLTSVGQPSMGLFSDEGGAFIGGYGMRPEDRLKTSAALSDLWDGKPELAPVLIRHPA